MNKFHSRVPRIADQLPSFIHEEHPHFITFLEAYYSFLEQQGNPSDLLFNLLNNNDIDLTNDIFFEFFRKEYLSKLPKKLYQDVEDPTRKVDARKVIKNVYEFYRAKGTEKSYRYLFRILFDLEIDFYYPRTDILRPSDGKWIQFFIVRGQQLSGNPFDFASTRIRGLTTNASAFVESVIGVRVGPYVLYEFFLNRSTISGTFEAGEILVSEEHPDTTIQVATIWSKLNITEGGRGYKVGEFVKINQNGPGYGGLGKVTYVGEQGELKRVDIVDPGAGYQNGILPSQVILPTPTGPNAAPAKVQPVVGGQTRYIGYYLNDDGWLNSLNYIQDSFFYQQFSYVIKVEESIDKYEFLVKELVHPAGLKLFGNFISVKKVDVPINPNGTLDCSDAAILMLSSLASPTFKEDHETVLYIILEQLRLDDTDLQIVESSTVYPFFMSYGKLDQIKLSFLGNGAGQEEDQMIGLNASYWDTEAGNTQLKDLFDLKLEDFIDRPFLPINIQPEIVLLNSTNFLGVQYGDGRTDYNQALNDWQNSMTTLNFSDWLATQ